MSDLHKAASAALEALEGVLDTYGEPLDLLSISGGAYEALQCRDAITALRAALAEPEQEPLPFGIEERAGVRVLYSKDGSCRPATAEEWLMWGIISAAISGDKERTQGVGGDA